MNAASHLQEPLFGGAGVQWPYRLPGAAGAPGAFSRGCRAGGRVLEGVWKGSRRARGWERPDCALCGLTAGDVPKAASRSQILPRRGCVHGTDLCSSLDVSVITCGGQPAKTAPAEVSQERAECPGTGKCSVAILLRPLVRQRAAGPSYPSLGYSMKSEF